MHGPENSSGFLPTYEPWLIPTCESSDLHRQQTKFATFILSLQNGNRFASFALTYKTLLSTRQTAVDVCRQSDRLQNAGYQTRKLEKFPFRQQTGSHRGFLSDFRGRTSACFPLIKECSISPLQSGRLCTASSRRLAEQGQSLVLAGY